MDAHDGHPISRRQAVGLVGFGMAATASESVLSQPGQEHSNMTAANEVQDPRTKYPKPPFKAQTQPWPGQLQRLRSSGRPQSSDYRRRFRHGPCRCHRLRP
jgi:hypothetical protein